MVDGKPAIEFCSVTKKYGQQTVVADLNLAIPQGKITVFVGPSGCGKTTSLRMINRMVEPSAGQIFVNGRANTDLPAYELRRQMGYVLQQAGLLPHKTIVDNIATVPLLQGESRRRARTRALELMETVGLEQSLAKRYPAQLSGGQAQRVGVARALASHPSIILMDEPFSAVDPLVRVDLQQEILRLQSQLNRSIIFVTHDMDEAIKLGDLIAVFARGGRVAQFASPEEILRQPADDFVAAFAGKDRGMRRLSFARADQLKIYPLDMQQPPWQKWRLQVQDGKPLGWLVDGRSIPGGTLFRQGSSLRDALDSVLSSPSGWGVAVDREGKVLGLLNSDDVLDATERERLNRYGVST